MHGSLHETMDAALRASIDSALLGAAVARRCSPRCLPPDMTPSNPRRIGQFMPAEKQAKRKQVSFTASSQ
jgi:hypothetical protein